MKKIAQVNIPETINYIQMSQLCGDIGDQPNQHTSGVHIYINTKSSYQSIKGLGTSFSEIGGKNLLLLETSQQEQIMSQLFGEEGLTYGRIPIGSSDFALDYYSLDDYKDDFEMQKFSLERDKAYLIPFISKAIEQNSEIKFHASPWSPPEWMKDNAHYSGGSLVDQEAYYHAYALYFLRFIEAYKQEGVKIDILNVQNEPDVHSKYPSCIMPIEQMKKFIEAYLYPLFIKEHLETEIFAGTFRTHQGSQAYDLLTDATIKQYIKGIGVQYTTMQPIYDIRATHPELQIIHTESKCFNGENSWEQAICLYMDIIDHINAGCSLYTYWNTILDETGQSSWGWQQNSLISIDAAKGLVTYNPDFEIMSLVAKCLKPNARRVSMISLNKRGLAVEQSNGDVYCLISNFMNEEEVGEITINGKQLSIRLDPMSISIYVIGKEEI